jgi:glycerate-2-kinase
MKMKREQLLDIFNAAIAAVDPYQTVKKALKIEGNRLSAGAGNDYSLDQFDRIVVVGAGKAAAPMARAAEESLGDRITGGLIVVRYGQAGFLRRIDQREASHPIPDQAGVEATRRILDMVQGARERTLVICLLSGGGSSLLVQPMPGISLEAKQRVTELLLRAGATIHEMNTVRKHLSRVKGGWLSETAYPATVLTLLISDVIGNALDIIASGPTAPDSSTYSDAAAVIEKYGLRQVLPAAVTSRIERGVKGEEAETPKSPEPCFSKTRNVIIGGIDMALAAARDRAAALGMSSHIVTAELQGEAREAARLLAGNARESRSALRPGEQRCLLSGGETTVTVRGSGLGGRNQELALAFAREIDGVPGIALLSAGTDGIDGPTDAAGAMVDGTTAGMAREQGLDPATYLERNDSYSFFKRLDLLAGSGSHVVTGPTGTNVMDLQVICIENKE